MSTVNVRPFIYFIFLLIKYIDQFYIWYYNFTFSTLFINQLNFLIQGGVQNNVVPPEIIVGFDIRIAADADHEEMEKWINVMSP